MTWGNALASAWHAAGDAAREAAATAVSSARAAAEAVQQAAVSAARAAADAAVAVGQAAWSRAQAVGRGVVVAGKGVANVAGFSARAAGETAVAGAKGAAYLADKGLEQHPMVGTAYKAAKQLLSPTKPPRERVSEICPNSEEGKIERLEERIELIKQGRAAGATPKQRVAADRLARNNEAVELARLSEDTYKQFNPQTPPTHQPPVGWRKMDDTALAEAGIDKSMLEDSKAVIYQTPKNWPGGQKTVLAFRGTVPSEADDLKTNMDQALGGETVQYTAASQLGDAVSQKLGGNTVVTGHSLGGGKAQAAGASGGLKGMMFNSAGLHPNMVGDIEMPGADQFLQYRAPYDPLTGIQNSAALQGVVAGVAGVSSPLATTASVGNFVSQRLGMPLMSSDTADLVGRGSTAYARGIGNLFSKGYVIPPAVGEVVQVPSLNDDGQPIGTTDLGEQHSVHNVINGIEREKSEDIATLKQ